MRVQHSPVTARTPSRDRRRHRCPGTGTPLALPRSLHVQVRCVTDSVGWYRAGELPLQQKAIRRK
jgi:hypothetical protein